MDLKRFIWLKDIDLMQYFGLISHKVRLKKDLWNRQLCAEIVERELSDFKCYEWNERATLINHETKKYYWDNDFSLNDSCNDNVQLIEDYWYQFNKKLIKVEKMLILVQERELFFSTNENNHKISKDDEAKIQLS